MRRALILVLLLSTLAASAAAHTEVALHIDNRAGVPAQELAAIERDFRVWASRVYAYHDARPGPVTVRITNRVPFGFYSRGTVMLPPGERWNMLDDFVHEVTHHVTGHDSSFFLKEGTSVHTLEALFAREDRVPGTWPQFGRSTDAWVALYVARGRMLPLKEALSWPHYRGRSAEEDFRSWQIYNIAGSFTGWYRERYGQAALRGALKRGAPAQAIDELERAWLADIASRRPASFDPAEVIPRNRRYDGYVARLSN